VLRTQADDGGEVGQPDVLVQAGLNVVERSAQLGGREAAARRCGRVAGVRQGCKQGEDDLLTKEAARLNSTKACSGDSLNESYNGGVSSTEYWSVCRANDLVTEGVFEQILIQM
jgi:hypothetical protein